MTMFSLNYLLKHPLSKCSTLWIRASTYKFGGAWSRPSCPPLRRPLSASPCHSGPQPLWLFLSQGLQTFCSFCLQCSFPRIPHGFLFLFHSGLTQRAFPVPLMNVAHPSPHIALHGVFGTALVSTGIYLFVCCACFHFFVSRKPVCLMHGSVTSTRKVPGTLPSGWQTDRLEAFWKGSGAWTFSLSSVVSPWPSRYPHLN